MSFVPFAVAHRVLGSLYSGTRLIRMANGRKIVLIIRACELSEPSLHYILINDRELCPGQPCELSGRCELARIKLSRLYCRILLQRLTKVLYSYTGTRMCMGSQYAKSMMFLTVSYMLQRFTLKFPVDQPNPTLEPDDNSVVMRPQSYKVCAVPALSQNQKLNYKVTSIELVLHERDTSLSHFMLSVSDFQSRPILI